MNKKIINARGWNDYDHKRKSWYTSIRWRIMIGNPRFGGEWYILKPEEIIRVLESKHQHTSKYTDGWQQTYAGKIQVSEETYNKLIGLGANPEWLKPN